MCSDQSYALALAAAVGAHEFALLEVPGFQEGRDNRVNCLFRVGVSRVFVSKPAIKTARFWVFRPAACGLALYYVVTARCLYMRLQVI